MTLALTRAMRSHFGTKKRRLGGMEYVKAMEFVLGQTAVCTAECGLKACAMVREPTQTLKAMSTKANGRTIRCTAAERWTWLMVERFEDAGSKAHSREKVRSRRHTATFNVLDGEMEFR